MPDDDKKVGEAASEKGGEVNAETTGTVVEGMAGASQSFPGIGGFAGYGTIYLDPKGYTRTVPGGSKQALGIATGKWPPGYRISDGSTKGGIYPPSGTTPKGTEPIRLQMPVKGTNRVQYLTMAKILVKNTGNNKASFSVGLGVTNPSEFNRPCRPYLGYLHDLGTWEGDMAPETLAPGEARTVTMFRVDTVDNALNGGAMPNWPNWEMALASDGSNLYPAVAIILNNSGSQAIQVGDVFAGGVVL